MWNIARFDSTTSRSIILTQRHLLVLTKTMSLSSHVSMAELPNLISKALTEQANRLYMSIEHSQQFLSDKLDDFGEQILKLKTEVVKLRAENDYLKKSVAALSTKADTVTKAVHKQETELDMQRRSELSCNAVVLGIPRLPNEDTKSLVNITCQTIGFHDAADSIVSCTRLPSTKAENNPIRITFGNANAKENLIVRKKNFGPLTVSMINGVRWPYGWTNKVFIRDELSPLTMEIFRELKLQKPLLKYRYAWPGRNGVIFVKYAENSQPIIVRSRCDLHKLVLKAQN